jgi:hypothetical protein
MNKLKKALSLILLFFVLASCSTSDNKEDLRFLLIGNSYTYYNSIPELLKALIQEKFPEH